MVRAVRGRKARTLDRLFDEFAAALQFPYYFGENWAAFRDCISDLDWLPFKPGVVVVVYGADEVLADAHPADMTTLVQTLATASEEFAEAVKEGEWWGCDPVPSPSFCRVSHTATSSVGGTPERCRRPWSNSRWRGP